MPIYDNLTELEKGAVSEALRLLKRQIEPINDTLEGIRRLVPPLTFGLDAELTALSKLTETLEQRWLHYMINKEWKNGENVTEQLGTARASAKALTEK